MASVGFTIGTGSSSIAPGATVTGPLPAGYAAADLARTGVVRYAGSSWPIAITFGTGTFSFPWPASFAVAAGSTLTIGIDLVKRGALDAPGDNVAALTYRNGLPDTVARPLDEVLRQSLSVKDFGAVGDNGTNDTAAATAAVAAALAASATLVWPAGTYVTTASIPNFHSVRHVGPGAVKRGTILFYVEAGRSQSNNLYVSATGSDTNDGLSTAQPRRTIQGAVNAFLAFRPLRNTATIWLAAGTYNENVLIPDYQVQADGYLTIRGPTTATVRTTPTAIIDGTSLSVNCAINGGVGNKVNFRDLLFTNWTGGADCVQIGVGTLGYMRNCQSLDGTARALGVADRCAVLVVQGGGKIGGIMGFDCYSGSTMTIGNLATSTADGTFIRNTTQCAFYLKSHSHVLSAYGDYTDNAVVVWGYHNSRYGVRGDNFKRNTLVFKMMGSYISEEFSPAPQYNYGTADANTTVYSYDQYSAEDIFHAGGKGGLDVAHQQTSTTITGTVAATLARSLKTLPAYNFLGTGRYIEVECVLGGTGSAGTKTVQLKLGSTVIGTYTLASGSVYGKFRCMIWARTATNVAVINEVSGSLTLVTPLRTAPIVDLTTDANIEVWFTVPGAADTAVLYEARCVLWG